MSVKDIRLDPGVAIAIGGVVVSVTMFITRADHKAESALSRIEMRLDGIERTLEEIQGAKMSANTFRLWKAQLKIANPDIDIPEIPL